MQIDLTKEPLGHDKNGTPVFLSDIWPSSEEVQTFIDETITSKMFKTKYAEVFDGDTNWRKVKVPAGLTYAWDMGSTYVQNPPYFEGMTMEPKPIKDIENAHVLGLFLEFDHHRPHLAGGFDPRDEPGRAISRRAIRCGRSDFNQYGTRRGNHEVMMRGTFANIRIKNQMVKDENGAVVEGGFTIHHPSGERMAIYDAAMRYQSESCAAGRVRRARIRHRLVTRLGGQGHQAARRPGGDRAELRAHPPLQPRRHGRAAARVRGGNVVGLARPQGRRDGVDPRPRRGPQAAPDGWRSRSSRRRAK